MLGRQPRWARGCSSTMPIQYPTTVDEVIIKRLMLFLLLLRHHACGYMLYKYEYSLFVSRDDISWYKQLYANAKYFHTHFFFIFKLSHLRGRSSRYQPLSGPVDTPVLYQNSRSATVNMSRPSHTRSPSPSFHDFERGYMPSSQQSYNNANASMQSMTISDHEPFGNPTGEYAFAGSPFTSPYAQQSTSSVFTDLNPSQQVPEYALSQNYNPYSMDVMPSNLATASDQIPFPLPGQQFYQPDGAYNEPGSSQMVDSYGLDGVLDSGDWLSSVPPTGSSFTGADSGLSYDSGAEGVLLGSSSTNDGSSRTTPNQEKRPRIVTTREDGNYECTVDGCGKLFNRSYNYRAHMETHDVDRVHPFICALPDCMKRFRRKTDLQRHHQSVHLKEKSHQCEYCGRFFSRKDTLGR